MSSGAGAAAGDASQQHVFKLCICGNGSAGKTTLCRIFKDSGFKPTYRQTIGIEWYEKKLVLQKQQITLSLWDVGGQSLSSPMMESYLSGCKIVFLVYDITDAQSFADLEDWLGLVRKHADSKSNVYLLGNKADLEHLRQVDASKHDAFIAIKKLQGGAFVSAKSGQGVVTLLHKAAAAAAGIELTAADIAATERVLTAVVSATDDGKKLPGTAALEMDDLEAERRRQEGGACCSLQ